jgi:hypothetical protein
LFFSFSLVQDVRKGESEDPPIKNPYSVRSATTGSFLAALFAGARPEISVRRIERQTRKIALPMGNAAIFE